MSSINLIFPGLIIGVILYQTMFVAPTVFQTIDSENTSKFLRKIFPRFFIFIFTLSILAAIEAYYNSRGNTFYIIYLITSLFSLIAFFLIPMTNKATDNNDKNKLYKKTLRDLTRDESRSDILFYAIFLYTHILLDILQMVCRPRL